MPSPIASFRVEVVGPPPAKNRRYRVVSKPRPRMIHSKEFKDFVERLRAAWASTGHPTITSGCWRILIHSIWSMQRHLDIDVALGDVDAPISGVLDALQEIGALDNDARVVECAATKGHDPGRPRVLITLEVCDA